MEGTEKRRNWLERKKQRKKICTVNLVKDGEGKKKMTLGHSRIDIYLKWETESPLCVTRPVINTLKQNTVTKLQYLFGLDCNQPDSHRVIQYMLK